MTAAGGIGSGEVDSGYAWWRLVLTLILGTVACVGNWSVVVLLPTLQVEFETVRGGASLPYTCTMLGFAFGGVAMGRLADRVGIVVPVLVGALLLCIGYVMAAFTTNIWQFAACSLVIGLGSAAGFSPLISDLSLWFSRHRGLAVAFAASGSYLSGAVWPMAIEHFQTTQGWRTTHVGIGLFVPLVMVPIGCC
jgi:MFS family permease